MNSEIYLDLHRILTKNPRLVSLQRPGLCRTWTANALSVADTAAIENNWPIALEAREVEVEPFLFHTFLWTLLTDSQPYVYDAIGAGFHAPFYGFEAEAPHLQNSQYDQINYYVNLKSRVKKLFSR